MIVDFHSHIDLYSDFSKVILGCKDRGIYVLAVTTTPAAWSGTNRLVMNCPQIKVALGFHPQLAKARLNELSLFEQYLPKAKYVGEIGLDGSAAFKSSFAEQIKVFRHVLSCVNSAGGRILSIHSRQSVGLVLAEVRKISCLPVMHWFSGSKMELMEAINSGCWFSVGPSMLMSQKGRDLVASMPRNRVVTETDGPFATVKGRQLYPWDASLVFSYIASVWNISVDDVEDMLFENFLCMLKSLK